MLSPLALSLFILTVEVRTLLVNFIVRSDRSVNTLDSLLALNLL